MAWSTPMLFVSGAALTAAQLNTYVSNNLAETAPAKATTGGRYMATAGANSLEERAVRHDFVNASETTTSTSFVDLTTTGPSVTARATAASVVCVQCYMASNTVNATTLMAPDLTGVTTSAASTLYSLRATASTANAAVQASYVTYFTVNFGDTVYTAKYSVSSGTGTFNYRRLIVIPY